jgi:hypothetical protein
MIETLALCPKCKGFLSIKKNPGPDGFWMGYFCKWCRRRVRDKDLIPAPNRILKLK